LATAETESKKISDRAAEIQAHAELDSNKNNEGTVVIWKDVQSSEPPKSEQGLISYYYNKAREAVLGPTITSVVITEQNHHSAQLKP
jgi:hypothetical protein